MSAFKGIGIDWGLVLAQVVNFVLLAWILGRFLYKPMISRIETYEKSLAEAKVEKKRLEEEKTSIDEEKRQVLKRAKEESRDMIRQAEEIAEKVTLKAEVTATKQTQERLARVDDLIASQKAPMEERVRHDIGNVLRERLPAAFGDGSTINSAALDALQSGMREGFLSSLVAIGKNAESGAEEFVVRCGRRPAKKDEKAVVSAVRAAYGKGTKVRFEEDPSIVAGWATEIGGIVVERHLLSVITAQLDVS